MRVHIHPSWHWALIVAVLAAALFTIREAHGQTTGPAAVFEGRPAMGGAQAGQGPMAGPPQGGIAPQSRDDPRSGLEIWKPRRDNDRDLRNKDSGISAPGGGGELKPQQDRDAGDVVKRPKDRSGIEQQNGTQRTLKRATKRTIERARRGVSGIDG